MEVRCLTPLILLKVHAFTFRIVLNANGRSRHSVLLSSDEIKSSTHQANHLNCYYNRASGITQQFNMGRHAEASEIEAHDKFRITHKLNGFGFQFRAAFHTGNYPLRCRWEADYGWWFKGNSFQRRNFESSLYSVRMLQRN
ncbi:hypothetical protein CDAR_61821 [Caerostris darwini]|uniref:Fibrinogen C-terminal domain-containing protein n=1 Tax=Caerostris darwini TaxID=1538125 RepID=A0AAV4VLP4_9ARAC|nr:hypothetical protein CDAR_61821 [Caerostris darwini]